MMQKASAARRKTVDPRSMASARIDSSERSSGKGRTCDAKAVNASILRYSVPVMSMKQFGAKVGSMPGAPQFVSESVS